MINHDVLISGVILHEDFVLIHKRLSGIYSNLWEFPGCRVKFFEHPEKSLIKYAKFNLGLDLFLDGFYMFTSHLHEDSKKRHFIFLTYLCFSDSKDSLKGKWVKVKDLEKYDFTPADKPIAQKLLSERVKK
jgi:8-oxo-dGTP diphosphatase